MSNVANAVDEVNPKVSVDEVCAWVDAQEKKGDMLPGTARLRTTALRAIAAQVADGEEGDAEAVLANMDRLSARWCMRNRELHGETAKTYVSRARRAIAEFLRWREDPTGYRPLREARLPSEGKPRTARAKPVRQQPDAPAVAAAPTQAEAPTATRAAAPLRTAPLSGGREFAYLLPVDGLRVADVRRLAYHLATMCEDYDCALSPAQVLAESR